VISYPEDGHAICRQVEADSFWFRHRNRCLLAALDRFPPGGKLYDVGGGNGFVAHALQEAGHPAALVEPGPAGAARARETGVHEVVEATLAGSDLPAGRLDAIGVFDVIEHQADDRAFLELLRRYLRPGGRLYATVPAYGALWSEEDAWAGHHRRYRRRTLTRAIEAAGFEVEYATYFFWLLPVPVALLRVVPERLGRRRKPGLETARREHTARGPLAWLVDGLLAWEPAALRAGWRLPFGGSVLCVAKARA